MDKLELLQEENKRLFKRQSKLMDLLEKVSQYAEETNNHELDDILTDGLYELALDSLNTLNRLIDEIERDK